MKAPAPQCGVCRHLQPRARCTAFPGGIPEAIWSNLADHREPFAGDGGVRFEPSPAIDPEAVRARLARQDAIRERLAAAGIAVSISLSETPGAEGR